MRRIARMIRAGTIAITSVVTADYIGLFQLMVDTALFIQAIFQ